MSVLLLDTSGAWLGYLLGGMAYAIVIAVVLLLFLAAIGHVLRNESLSPSERGIWIAIILWMNILGFVLYYLFACPVQSPQRTDSGDSTR